MAEDPILYEYLELKSENEIDRIEDVKTIFWVIIGLIVAMGLMIIGSLMVLDVLSKL